MDERSRLEVGIKKVTQSLFSLWKLLLAQVKIRQEALKTPSNKFIPRLSNNLKISRLGRKANLLKV